MSISTLRRRIKAGEIEYQFSDGKYLLRDIPMSRQAWETAAPPPTVSSAQAPAVELEDETLDKGEETQDSSLVWTTANKLLNEIKKAYSLILQEKEEQILQLKEEVSDLKTLVRVLEEQNQRLQEPAPIVRPASAPPAHSLDLDEWLKDLSK